MITYFKQIPIHYTIKGEGPCIVLLHGFLLSSSIWIDLAPKLSKKNKVITIDLPGHGKSGSISEIHTMELMAEVVNYILEENNILKASIIGHSMGGYIALAFTEKYKSKVETLVLLNSTTLPDSPERKINRDRAIRVIQSNSQVFIKMAITSLFPENKQTEYNSEIELFIKEALGFPKKGIIAAINGMKNRKDLTSVLQNFKGGKYMICGEKDLIVPFNEAKKVAKTSKAILKNVKSGHMSVNENIDEIIKIMHFIDFI